MNRPADSSHGQAPDAATLRREFQRTFGTGARIVARAPGRVEFIGNHTDYNGGAVLGAAINRHVWVAAAPNGLGLLRFATEGGGAPVEIPSHGGVPAAGSRSWTHYPLGVWLSLAEFGAGRPADFDLLVHSDLPSGAGLSSSAALELATALALRGLTGQPPLATATLAAIARHAENAHVGTPCGILDQGTCAFGLEDHLVHIDCRGPRYGTVPMPPGARLWIFNTLQKHALVDGLYAERHRECGEAARALGVALLTDLDPAALGRAGAGLDPLLHRRARHVVEEHARVAGVVRALAAGDVPAVGRLLTESHWSSSRLFENSTPALDSLVTILAETPGVAGARLTGGGFGGAVMALTSADFGAAQARAVADLQAAGGHGAPDILDLRTTAGAGIAWTAAQETG